MISLQIFDWSAVIWCDDRHLGAVACVNILLCVVVVNTHNVDSRMGRCNSCSVTACTTNNSSSIDYYCTVYLHPPLLLFCCCQIVCSISVKVIIFVAMLFENESKYQVTQPYGTTVLLLTDGRRMLLEVNHSKISGRIVAVCHISLKLRLHEGRDVRGTTVTIRRVGHQRIHADVCIK